MILAFSHRDAAIGLIVWLLVAIIVLLVWMIKES